MPVCLRCTATPAARPGGYLWLVFDEDGSSDAADILTRMNQREGTETPIPGYLPGAGEESDRKRCDSNASLASAIVAGPATVIELCQNLRERIASYKQKGIIAVAMSQRPDARCRRRALGHGVSLATWR